MRPIFISAMLAVLVCGTAFAQERFYVNRDKPYENRASVSIEYRPGEKQLLSERAAVQLVIDRVFSISDRIILVANASVGDMASLALADARLTGLKTAIQSAGVPESRINTLIDRGETGTQFIDVFVVPHTWESLPSSVVQKHIDEAAGTSSVIDTASGLQKQAIGSVLVKDGEALSSLESVTDQLGWDRFEGDEVKGLRFASVHHVNFEPSLIPAKASLVSDVFREIQLNNPELEGYIFKVYPNEKLIHFYKGEE